MEILFESDFLIHSVHWRTTPVKNKDTRLLSVTLPNVTDVQNSCTDRFISKFAIKSFSNILLHLKGITTLLCKILRSENSNNLKHIMWLVINHKVV